MIKVGRTRMVYGTYLQITWWTNRPLPPWWSWRSSTAGSGSAGAGWSTRYRKPCSLGTTTHNHYNNIVSDYFTIKHDTFPSVLVQPCCSYDNRFVATDSHSPVTLCWQAKSTWQLLLVLLLTESLHQIIDKKYFVIIIIISELIRVIVGQVEMCMQMRLLQKHVWQII